MRIAIIGGGIAGMAAAFELEKARTAGNPVEYTLFESRERLGGSLSSEIVNGTLIEQGPDSFLTEKPAAADLCRELGLGGELLPSNDAARKTYIVVGNRLVALPDGLMFLVPTKLIPTALTRLFSISTKVRMALELLHPPRPTGLPDEAVADLVRRHFGQEAVDRLADPLLSGIYGGDSAQLSARTVLPGLVKMESEYGSLTRGMLAAHAKMRGKAKESTKKNGTAQAGAKPAARAIFTSLRGGMQQLINALIARLEKAGDKAERYDAVIVSSPAWAAGVMLAPVDAALSEELSAIPYSSSITVNLVYDEGKLGRLPDGFGFLVPAVEGRAMLAATFVHRKFLGRTPPGKAVIRAFLGGMKNEALLTETDEALVAMVRRDLNEILGEKTISLALEPEYAQVARWRRAMAQYAVGHQDRTARIAARVAALPGLRLAGNAYDGIGIPDCIRLGRLAARELTAAQ